MERFWSKVEKTNGCWNWMAVKNKGGYGFLKVNKKNCYAHRFSWELHNGKIPKGICVLHKCDNRACVRLSHLFLGTYKDNTKDMLDKGRDNFPSGEKNGMAKVNENKVKEIRKIYAMGNIRQVMLGKLFGITQSNISRVVNKLIWKNI